jgi:hypothetical protein
VVIHPAHKSRRRGAAARIRKRPEPLDTGIHHQFYEEEKSIMGASPAVTRRDLETRLVEKAWKDPEFRREVVSDPKGMFEKYLGQKLPAQLNIIVHEEDASTVHLSIPPAPSNLSELSDTELEQVSGGSEVAFSLTMLAAVTAATAVGTAVGSAAGATVKSGW